MKTKSISIVLMCSIYGSSVFASGGEPCSKFVSSDHKTFLIGEAYKASELVVTGEISDIANPILKVRTIIKGSETKKEIQLTKMTCQGTSCWGGFSVAPKMEMLFFLKKSGGVYDSVTGNGNVSCPVVYEVEKSSVKFKEKSVSLDRLKKYLEDKPDSIPMY